MKAVIITIVFALAITQVFAFSSQCNDGACAITADCKVGKCCNDKCVAMTDFTTLASGATCSATDACNICPTGQFCISGTCAVPPAVNCTKVNQETCSCNDTLTCQAGNACVGGFCRKSGLTFGDYCLEASQCASTNCTDNRCSGPEVGAPCTSGFTCGADGYCNFGPPSICVAKGTLGEACVAGTKPCMDFFVCSAGKCVALGNVSRGDACTAPTDCQGTDDCVASVCTSTSGYNCTDKGTGAVDTCNTAYDQCKCNGTEETSCAPIRNLCTAQRTTLYQCLIDNGCSYNFGFFITLGSNSSCGARNCQEEYLNYLCCGGCGNDAAASIITPNFGLTCTATGHTYTAPAPVCDACSVALAPGSCGAATSTSNSENPTGTDNTNASSSLKAFVCLVALLVAAAL